MNQRRPEQLAAILRDAIQARIDRGLADPRIQGMITVTGVQVARDLKSATVLISVMPHTKQDLTLHGLTSASRHIRREVGDEVSLHQMPELAFKLDRSLEKQAGVLDAIARVTAEREQKAAQAAESGKASEQPAYAPEQGPQPQNTRMGTPSRKEDAS
jgi:ribosome-binding factor A